MYLMLGWSIPTSPRIHIDDGKIMAPSGNFLAHLYFLLSEIAPFNISNTILWEEQYM